MYQSEGGLEKGEEGGRATGEMTFRFTFLPLQAARLAWQQDTARNATTHPRSALDENSLVRRRLHSALRPLVDSEGEEEGLPLRFVGGSQGKTVTTYKQLLPSFFNSIFSRLISFHSIVLSIQFELE